MALKAEHKIFIKKFIETSDHIESYLAAFPNVDRKTAATTGKRWLKMPSIASEIERQKAKNVESVSPQHIQSKDSEEPRGPGQPSPYKPEYCVQVEKLCKLGATDKEVADFFGVCEATINNWKKAHPEFFESLKRGKLIADAEVADRLFQRAKGFEHDSEEIKVVSDGQGLGSSIERVPIRKIYPPDTTAAIFWLKNRQKEKWRDGKDITTGGEKLPPPQLPLVTQIEVIHTNKTHVNQGEDDPDDDTDE